MRAAARGAVSLLVLFAHATAAAAITVADDAGRRLTLPEHPARIVSLAPGATEMLFAAGAGTRVVATAEYSDEPPAARSVPRIGDSVAIDVERLVILRPDVVIVWPGGNNAAQIATIERLRLPIYRHRVNSLSDLAPSIRRLGALTGTQAVANAAASRLESRLEQLEARYSTRAPVSVLLQIWNRPIYTVGGSQLISDALRVCGARNAFADLRELGPALGVEAVIARDPDLIIAAAPPNAAAEWLEDWKKFPSLRAVRHGNLIAFEDQRLSRLGPSVVDATEALCRAIDAGRARR